MTPLLNALRRAAACVALLASAPAMANHWQMNDFLYPMANGPVVGRFFDDGATFADWDIQTAFSPDYTGFHYTSANSSIHFTTLDYIFIGLNGVGTGSCTFRDPNPQPGAAMNCLQLRRPRLFDGSTVAGDLQEWRVTHGGYSEGRAHGGTYAPIPEPATTAMLLLGGGLVAWTARRRRT